MNRKDGWILLSFVGLILVLYYPTRQAGFVTDFYGWQTKFNEGSFSDVFTTFGWHANQQVAVFFLYLLYLVFGIHGWGWYLFFSFVHAWNGFIAFKFFKRLLVKFSVKHAAATSAIGALFFLVSPYQAEVLVWRVCVHYLLATLFTLLILTHTLNYLESGNRKFLWQIHLLFLLSLFTLEISLIIPILLIVLVLIWNSTVRSGKPLWSYIPQLILPQFAGIGMFFLMNKIILNQWVGHYGAATHFNISFHDIFSNYFRYFFKYLFFTRYLDEPLKTKIFGIAESQTGIDVLLSLFLLGFFACIIFYRHLSNPLRMAGMSLIMFFVSLTPVITLYMVTLLYGENDRYGYLASIFFWMTLSILLSAITAKVFYPITALILGVSIFFLVRTNSWWSENSCIYYSLLNDFRWYDKDEVVILNIPDNYRGLYMFRIYNEPSGFKEGLELIRKKPFNGKMREVTQFNMMTPNDGVNVKSDSLNNLTVTFNQWGNWWWWEGIGNSDFDDDQFKVHFDGISYHILFKELQPNYAIIYQVGHKWEEVNTGR